MSNKRNIESRETTVRRYFELLKDNIGKQIEVTEVAFGDPFVSDCYILRNVFDYQTIAVSYPSDIDYINGNLYGHSHHEPFICQRIAIQQIRGNDGEILYKNPFIRDTYDVFPGKDFDKLVKRSFGASISFSQGFIDFLRRYQEQRERAMRRLCGAIKCIETLTSSR